MNRDKLLMLAATATRMAVGLVTFIVLARYLSPAPFGVLATAIAYSGFVAILSDFGLGIYALRAAAMAPESAARIVRDSLALKAAVSLAALMVATPIALAILPADRLPIYLLALLGTTAYSAGDLALVVARAHRRFDIEAKLVIATSVLLMAGVAGTAALTGSVLAAAAAFAGTRVLYLAVILIVLRPMLAAPPADAPLRARVLQIGAAARVFAVDSVLTALSGQVDVLLFGALLTAHDIGIYQAGARLVQVIMPFAVVLSTVYMPTLAAAVGQRDVAGFRRHSARLTTEFTLLALLGGAFFALAGPFATDWLYGDRYAAMAPLWSGFGAFAILRFAAAAYGIELAALGHIRTRIAAQLLSIAVFTAAAAWFLPRFGLAASAWLLAVSGLPVLLVLGVGLLRDERSGKSVAWGMAASLAGAALLVLV